MKLTKKKLIKNVKHANSLMEIDVKVLNEEGKAMSKEELVEYLNAGNEVYCYQTPLLDLGTPWMVYSDEDVYDQNNEGVFLLIIGDTVWIDYHVLHNVEGRPLEYSYKDISARELRKAFDVKDDDALAAAIQEYCQFEQRPQYLKGWRELRAFLEEKGVNFTETYKDFDAEAEEMCDIMTEDEIDDNGEDYIFPILDLGTKWMAFDDGDGYYQQENEGVFLCVMGDKVEIVNQLLNEADGAPLEYTIKDILIKDLFKAFDVEEDVGVLAVAINKYCQFAQGPKLIQGWNKLKDYLKNKGVGFVETCTDFGTEPCVEKILEEN